MHVNKAYTRIAFASCLVWSELEFYTLTSVTQYIYIYVSLRRNWQNYFHKCLNPHLVFFAFDAFRCNVYIYETFVEITFCRAYELLPLAFHRKVRRKLFLNFKNMPNNNLGLRIFGLIFISMGFSSLLVVWEVFFFYLGHGSLSWVGLEWRQTELFFG